MSNPASNNQRPAGFDFNTRSQIYQMEVLTRPTGGGISRSQIPKIGLLGRMWLVIRATVAGTLSAPNALGASSIISRVRVSLNNGQDVFNVSGAGYSYLLDETMEGEEHRMTPQNQGRTAVTATTFNLDMYIPLMYNLRDAVGLLLLQNNRLTAELIVDWAADTVPATGVTSIVATATPFVEAFTLPINPHDYPDVGLIHQIVEDQRPVSGAGDFPVDYLLGGTYIQILHGLGLGVSGSDLFSRYRLRYQQTNYIFDWSTAMMDMLHQGLRGRARPAGGIYADLAASSGLGNYGKARDFFDTSDVTDWAGIITATGAGTLFTIRRQLVRANAA